MTTRYRVEYALKSHRRDQFIEWIKGLLAVPFVLYSQPTGSFDGQDYNIDGDTQAEAHRRYKEILSDIERMIAAHIAHQTSGQRSSSSKLQLLVPSAGPFFTALPLAEAFEYQDTQRHISSRRFVSPSFNDIRLILNSAQLRALTAIVPTPSLSTTNLCAVKLAQAITHNRLIRLATFDGDVTLYDDGQSLLPTSPLVPHLLRLLRAGIKIGIVTAAGYSTPEPYYNRLHGLLDAMANPASGLTPTQQASLIIIGGEANYLLTFVPGAPPPRLALVPREQWLASPMRQWQDADVNALLDAAEAALRDCVDALMLPAHLLRKDRSVGIVPDPAAANPTAAPPVIPRESLEETVLLVQKACELSPVGQSGRVPFCAFNSGRDVFVDIGDKSWGVRVCQRWFGRQILNEARGRRAEEIGQGDEKEEQEAFALIRGENTFHVGDQFLSAGANDFRARSVGTTAWIANPVETVELLDELAGLMAHGNSKGLGYIG